MSQIEKMKHAIGLDRPNQTKQKFVAHRNYFATGDDPEWNEIVDLDLAVKREDPFCKVDVIYHLTEEGIAYLSLIIGIKIILN